MDVGLYLVQHVDFYLWFMNGGLEILSLFVFGVSGVWIGEALEIWRADWSLVSC